VHKTRIYDALSMMPENGRLSTGKALLYLTWAGL